MTNRFLISDLDNTLYDYSEAHKPAQKLLEEYLSNRLDLHPKQIRDGLSVANRVVKLRLGATASSHSRLLYVSEYLRSIGCETHVELSLSAEAAYWLRYLDSMSLFIGAEEFLQTSRHMGYLNILVTDLTSSIQYRKLRILGLDKCFDVVLTSEESGGDKSTGKSEEILRGMFGEVSGICIGDNDNDHLFKESTLFFKKVASPNITRGKKRDTFSEYSSLQRTLFK